MCADTGSPPHRWATDNSFRNFLRQMPESGAKPSAPIPQLFPSPGHQSRQSPHHLFHPSQTRCVSRRAGDFSKDGHLSDALLWRSRICNAKPLEAWKAMWQCISQMPGLSVLKAITTWPPFCGSMTTSRLGGFVKLKVALLGVSEPSTFAMMAKSWPWRWI